MCDNSVKISVCSFPSLKIKLYDRWINLVPCIFEHRVLFPSRCIDPAKVSHVFFNPIYISSSFQLYIKALGWFLLFYTRWNYRFLIKKKQQRTFSVWLFNFFPFMYQDNLAGGLDPTVIQFMSYFRPALSGVCSLLNIVTDIGFTEK